jgi:poly(A) polymerase
MELADWWTRFQKVDGDERVEMLQPEQAGDKKRRRRKKPAGDSAVVSAAQ